MSVGIIDVTGGATNGNKLAIDASNQAKVALPTTAAAAGWAKVANADGDSFQFGNNGRLKIGQVHSLLYDPIEASNLNTNIWTTSTSTMTIVQASSVLTLNSGTSTTANTYAIISSNRSFQQLSEFPLNVMFRAKVIAQANSVIEFGLGLAATNAAPTDGVFFRVDSTGVLKGVINFNGSETLTAALATISASNVYSFELSIEDDQVLFEISIGNGSAEETTVARTFLGLPTAQAGPTLNSRLPIFARVYNTATPPASAPQLVLGSVASFQNDVAMDRPWTHTKAGQGLNVVQSPVTAFSQTQGWANAANPTTITPANAAGSAYTTLGGQFSFNAPVTGATDLAIFAFQVPAGFQFYVTDVFVSAVNAGAAVATTATILQWALAVNSSAISLATADGANTWQPRRLALGVTSWIVAAGIGAPANDIDRSFNCPIVCEPNRFIHVLIKPLLGTATASQVIQGIVTINGYWE